MNNTLKLDAEALRDVFRSIAEALDEPASVLASWCRTVDDAEDEDRSVNARISALDWIADFIAIDLRDAGPCDHSVGICYCGEARVLDNVRAVRRSLVEAAA